MIYACFARHPQGSDSAVCAADEQEVVISAMKEKHLGVQEAIVGYISRLNGMKFDRQFFDGINRKC